MGLSPGERWEDEHLDLPVGPGGDSAQRMIEFGSAIEEFVAERDPDSGTQAYETLALGEQRAAQLFAVALGKGVNEVDWSRAAFQREHGLRRIHQAPVTTEEPDSDLQSAHKGHADR